jgi:RNA polymerase sigma-70 factor (ECF subfamily)
MTERSESLLAMNTETDGQLVSRCLSGDVSAFEMLVDRHRASLVRHAQRRMSNLADAEDVAQESFVHAYFRLHQLREPEKFLPWLRSIADRFCLMHIRRRREEPVDPAEAERLTAASPGIREALDALPEPMLDAVKLTFLLGYTNSEAAEILGVREGTIKSRLSRARAILRMEMGIMSARKTGRSFHDEVIERLIRQARELLEQGDYAAAEKPLDEVLDIQFENGLRFDAEAVRMAESIWDEMRRRDAESNALQYGKRLEDLDWKVAKFNTLSNSFAPPGGEGEDLWGVPRETLGQLVDSRDICRRLKISPVALNRLVQEGVPVIRYRPWVRYDWERVQSWLAGRRVEPDVTLDQASHPLRFLFVEIESGRLTADRAERMFRDLDLPPV